MRTELGEVGIQSVCVLVRPDVAKEVQPGDEVSFPMGSWTVIGKVISKSLSSILLDYNRLVVDVDPDEGGRVTRRPQ